MNLLKRIIVVFCICINANVQAQFIQEAQITYERKTNIWKKVEANNDEEEDNSWIAFFKKNNEQYKTDSFSLTFKNNTSFYAPLGEEVTNKNNWWGNNPASRNEVFTNYNTQLRTSAKGIFEDDLLVIDSIKKLDWKITTETRIVGGFECRKATAKIMDSVFIIAFYTDQLMVTGGPEGFSGLPGCILIVSVPRMYTTWQATGIQIKAITDKELVVPKKGKKTTNKQLEQTLKSSIGKWGKWGQQYMHLISI